MNDALHARGTFHLRCWDDANRLVRSEIFPNTVVTVGMNQMLDSALAGAAYTVTGPFMGLISSVGFTGIVASDTMALHPGWNEAGNSNAPTYTGTRGTCAWSAAAAGSKALSAPLSYGITGAGTLKGAFIVFGAGATNAIDSTTGVLWSAGLFTGGDLAVNTGYLVAVTYSCSL